MKPTTFDIEPLILFYGPNVRIGSMNWLKAPVKPDPNNPLLQNLLKQNGAAPSGTSGKAYLTKEGVAASSHDETAALVSRIAEWKNLHHSVQELLLVVFDTDRQMAKLKTPALSAKERTAAAEELDRMWMTDTFAKSRCSKKSALSSFQLISREPAVVDFG